MESLSERIAHYQPVSRAAELIRSTKIVLLAGISGAGKDTLKKELLKKPEFRDIVSHTTRSPRNNNDVAEVDGVDYHFIDDAAAEAMLERQEFIEAKFVHGTVYGTSIGALERIHNEDKIAITDIDVQGVSEYKKISLDVIALFVLPPDYDTWLDRLKMRYAPNEFTDAEWIKRRDSAIKELTHALLVPYYHFIINDDLRQTILAAVEIISHESDEFHSKDDEARLRARELLETIRAHA
jgi:guanylate kinase